MKTQGPNVRNLIVARMAQLATPNRISDVAKEATEWVKEVIEILKSTPDNPYGDDDEAIAGEVLRQLEEKKKSKYKGVT